jgi:tetratricopeptide (TPR) repeat protein
MSATTRDRVFISYCHADAEWLNRVGEALAPDVRNGRMDAWDDRRIEAGDDWEHEILTAIDRARVALLLVTPRFLASSFIMEKELPLILAAASDGLTVLWMPIEGIFYGPGASPALEPITSFQAFGSPTRPLAGQSPEKQNEALLDLCRRIDRLLGRARIPRNLPFNSLGTLFKGREGAIDDLERHLVRHGAAAIVQPEAITGMGGIGKTRLAVEYAWRHQDEFDALLFVSAGSPEDLATNFARLCGPEVLDLAEYRLGKQPEQYEAVLQWLQKNAGWLLIFDNVDTAAAVAGVQALAPKLGGGQVVITSRIARWEGSVRALGLDLLSEAAAVDYLLERTAGGRQPQPDDEAQARALSQELGRLALALEEAAAYINARHSSLAAYRQRWQSARDRLLKYHDPLATHYANSIAATWLTSFEQLTENGRRLLRILAWLAAEPIPRTLLEAGGGPLAVDSEEAIPEGKWPKLAMDVDDALADLATYSLVSWSPEKTTFSVHGLVQEVTRRNQAGEEQQRYVAAALRWVNGGFVGDPLDVRNWPIVEPLAPHARATLDEADRRNIPEPTARLMNDLGIFYNARAEWGQAEPLYRRALAIDEKSYGPEHPDVATDLNNLAQLLKDTNRLPEVEPLYRRALSIWEKSFGHDHPNVAIALNNLASLLQATNRLAEAEPLRRRALAIDEEGYGTEHPDVAVRLNNLAQLLQDTNRLAEAEPLMRRALAIDEKTYGPEHPEVAVSLNNLAQLLQDTNRLAEAEPLMRRALAIDEKTYGPGHPKVAVRLNNLAQLLQDTNRLAEAEPLMRRALAIDEKTYGPEHPKVAVRLNNLSQLLKATNRLAEAEPLMRRALAIFEKSFGEDHPNVASALNNLAALLKATSRLAEAEPLMRRTLAIFEKSFGEDHPNVAIALNNLAQLLQDTNRLAEAEPLMRRALAIDEKSYGPEHPEVAIRLSNLAQLLQDTNRLTEAEPPMRRALAIDEKSYGPDHPRVAIDLNNLAQLLQATNRLAEAEPLLRRMLEIFLNFSRATGHPHPHLETAVNNYRVLLVDMGLTQGQAGGRLREIAPGLFQ